MSKRRIPNWLLLITLPIGIVLVAVPTLWVFVSLTAKPIYPNPESVPSTMDSDVLPKWNGAVEQARQITRARVAGQNLPGLSVAVGMDGDVVWAEGFGLADLRTNSQVTPRHRFRIGTASVALTSAAAGLLLEEGRLKLDNELQTYVPSFPRKQWPVTIRHLMGHTSGLIADGGKGSLLSKHCEKPLDALQYFAKDSLQFEPGSRYRFSAYDWILVSAAVEAAADQPFLAFMHDRIFDPYGMRETGPDGARMEAGEDFPPITLFRELIYDPEAKRGAAPDSTKRAQNRVTSYFTRFASDPNYGLHTARMLDYSCYAGAGAFVSTPSDLVRFGMAMREGKHLQPATVGALQTSQRLAAGQETGYGLGWDLRSVTLAGKPTRMVGSNGDSLGGNVMSLTIFPEYGLVVAVTSNISHADTPAIGLEIAETFVAQSRIPARK